MEGLHCSTGSFESSSLVLRLPLLEDVILAGSENRKMDGDHQNINFVAVPIFCNVYVQLN